MPNSLCYGNNGDNGKELWRFDGISASLIQDIRPGHRDSFILFLTPFNGELFFAATDGTNGCELWNFDGTSVSLVADINPGKKGSFLIILPPGIRP
ncbi:hypothetical protein [Coleofasciculus sp. E1-EBD-02]|uniref:hypothetical protein n=1 Tax=Coleofasciculus sp. E1-EBD-02 TaxID=3068481 RepID=UPI0032F74A8B